MDIKKIQNILNEYNFDGWLFSDFHGHDFITNEFLKLSSRKCTRRLFYYIPAKGNPIKILSAIEPLLLDHLEGELILYSGIKGQKEALNRIFSKGMVVACQYSPNGNVPVASSMDAGLIEYLKSFDIQLVSSANLLQHFGAVLTDEQVESHRQAGIIIHRILDNTFKWIRQNVSSGNCINEWDMLNKMKSLIDSENIYMDSPPFFGVDEHACDPGYEPKKIGSKQIKEGSRIIIDISGRLPNDNAIYYDVSWCMNVGKNIDSEYENLFNIVNTARKKAVDLIQSTLDKGQLIRGCDVDAYLYDYFKSLNLDKYLMHRTGHNIGHNCHGVGANLDDFETHDDRFLLPKTMFSIEPGIYNEKYGVRLEFDAFISADKKVEFFGPIQNEILII